jgi:hypothetical protein
VRYLGLDVHKHYIHGTDRAVPAMSRKRSFVRQPGRPSPGSRSPRKPCRISRLTTRRLRMAHRRDLCDTDRGPHS